MSVTDHQEAVRDRAPSCRPNIPFTLVTTGVTARMSTPTTCARTRVSASCGVPRRSCAGLWSATRIRWCAATASATGATSSAGRSCTASGSTVRFVGRSHTRIPSATIRMRIRCGWMRTVSRSRMQRGASATGTPPIPARLRVRSHKPPAVWLSRRRPSVGASTCRQVPEAGRMSERASTPAPRMFPSAIRSTTASAAERVSPPWRTSTGTVFPTGCTA